MSFEFLDGKTVAGEQGQGVLLENIVFKLSTNKEGKKEAVAEIIGTGKTVLRSKYNAGHGWDELPTEVPVSERVKFVLGNKNADNQITFQRLNQHFDIQPPLEDTPDVWQRFKKNGKDSVFGKIVGGRMYFSAKKNPAKTGEKLEDFYFNAVSLAKTVSGDDDTDELDKFMEAALAESSGSSKPVTHYS